MLESKIENHQPPNGGKSKIEARRSALERQIGRLERRIEALRARSERYSWLRLLLFVGLVAVCVMAYGVGGWLVCLIAAVISLVVFNVVAFYHRKLDRSITRHRLWRTIKQNQLARMSLDWEALPYNAGSQPSGNSEHPFENDLDITGPRSVHRLLDTASTQEGSQRLRGWLLATRPNLLTIERNQTLIGELVPRSRFRDRLRLQTALAASAQNEQWESRQLLGWLERNANSVPVLRPLLIMTAVCAMTAVLFVLSRFELVSNLFWIASFVVYVILYNTNAEPTKKLLDEAYVLHDGLTRLTGVLKFLEKGHYSRTPRLAALLQPILSEERRPSHQLQSVGWVVFGASLQRNTIIWLVINALVPWRYYFAHRLNGVKNRLAAYLPGWLDTWYELESLNSLANFAYLNPDCTFPRLHPETTPDQTVFNGEKLGHPLIPHEQRVTNDFSLPRTGEVIIITGSNMAGKSSFLRTLGVNLVLAYAGGVVQAERLETDLLRIFTCIKVSDSVTEGFSYFYAEVRRLKALLNELKRPDPQPLFFLIDEIFRGTNNRERLIGSRSYVRALAGQHSVGAISTHDLELVHLADDSPLIKNYHFRESVEDGQMVFDYKLRPGPSPTTNALVIMKMEGLPVENPDEIATVQKRDQPNN